MRSLLITLLCIFYWGIVHAKETKPVGDWVFIGNQGDGDSFYSASSIDREGDFVSVRTVMNIETGKNFKKELEPNKSFVSYFVIDCKRWLFVMKNSFSYEEKFGQGKLVLSFDENKTISEVDIKPIDKRHLLHKLAVAICKNQSKR